MRHTHGLLNCEAAGALRAGERKTFAMRILLPESMRPGARALYWGLDTELLERPVVARCGPFVVLP